MKKKNKQKQLKIPGKIPGIFAIFTEKNKNKEKNENNEDSENQEMANFYTEGLVEKESRKFCKSHEEVDLREANYGYNINFVNKIQKKMNADSYGVIFSENDYLKDISSYYNEYMKIKEQQKKDFNEIDKLVKNYPINITPRMLRKIKSVALIDGNISRIKENFKEINNNYKKQGNEVEI